jgi:hypothetical protein
MHGAIVRFNLQYPFVTGEGPVDVIVQRESYYIVP